MNATEIIRALINAASYSLVGVIVVRMIERVVEKVIDKMIERAFERMRGPTSQLSDKKGDTE